MGCLSVRTHDIISENFTDKVIKKIKDNLEANLVNQTSLNLDLDNIYEKNKKFGNNKDEINIDNIINTYSNLLINLANISNEQDKGDIKQLLFSIMNISSNNYFQFHLSIYRKLQCLNDYSNIKLIIERDSTLKGIMKRSRPLIIDIFENLKNQKIINISDLSHDNFKKACERRGIKMDNNQILNYYKLIIMKPKDPEVINQNIKIEFDKNKNLRNAIENNVNKIKSLIDEIIKMGIDYININLDVFVQMCKNNEINLEDFEIENLFNLIQKNFFDFIRFIDRLDTTIVKYDENLEIKSFKLDVMARIDSQPLPVVSKLSQV